MAPATPMPIGPSADQAGAERAEAARHASNRPRRSPATAPTPCRARDAGLPPARSASAPFRRCRRSPSGREGRRRRSRCRSGWRSNARPSTAPSMSSRKNGTDFVEHEQGQHLNLGRSRQQTVVIEIFLRKLVEALRPLRPGHHALTAGVFQAPATRAGDGRAPFVSGAFDVEPLLQRHLRDQGEDRDGHPRPTLALAGDRASTGLARRALSATSSDGRPRR